MSFNTSTQAMQSKADINILCTDWYFLLVLLILWSTWNVFVHCMNCSTCDALSQNLTPNFTALLLLLPCSFPFLAVGLWTLMENADRFFGGMTEERVINGGLFHLWQNDAFFLSKGCHTAVHTFSVEAAPKVTLISSWDVFCVNAPSKITYQLPPFGSTRKKTHH